MNTPIFLYVLQNVNEFAPPKMANYKNGIKSKTLSAIEQKISSDKKGTLIIPFSLCCNHILTKPSTCHGMIVTFGSFLQYWNNTS